MTAAGTARLDLGAEQPVFIHSVSMAHPWAWLRAGWSDMFRHPELSIGYGLIWVVLSLALVGGLWAIDQVSWLLPLIAGFMLMGPLVAVGAYDISLRSQRGEQPTLTSCLLAWRGNPTQIALMGLLLMIFLLAWIRGATLLFALFFGVSIPMVDPGSVYGDLLFTGTGLALIATGTVIGAILAFTAFALSVVSIPRLMDQPRTSVLEAVITSLTVVQHNLRPMLLWGAILSGVTLLGLAAGFIGLAIALPLLGHASWHAYRDLVSEG